MCINLSQYLTLKSHRATLVEQSFASMAGQLQTACGDVVTICLEDHVQSFTTDMEYNTYIKHTYQWKKTCAAMISMASSFFFSGNIAADIEAMIAPQKVSQG